MAYKNRKKNYPLYQTVEFDNLRTMTEDAAKKYGDKYLFSYRKKPTDKEVLHYTFTEGRDYIRDLATELIALGLRDKKVAIIGESAPAWVFSYHALMSIGAVTVPIDKELGAPEVANLINSSGAKLFVYADAKVEELCQGSIKDVLNCL